MIVFVGVGPGDPELLTVKAVRLLREADAIAAADSETGDSAILRIIGSYIGEKPVLRLTMPMKGNRSEWTSAHQAAADSLAAAEQQYPLIVYPVLGDPSVYATSSYLLRLLQNRCRCEIVPGIPAMCAAAARLGIPLCEQGETLTVKEGRKDNMPAESGTTVLMKSGRDLPEILKNAEGRSAYVVRNLGMEHEWVGLLSEIPEDGYSYFTTVIVRPKP